MPKGEFEFTWFRHANGAREGKDTSSSPFFFFKQRQHALSEFCSSKAKYKEKGLTVIKRALSQSECGNVKYNNQGQNPGYNQAMGSYNGAAWT